MKIKEKLKSSKQQITKVLTRRRRNKAIDDYEPVKQTGFKLIEVIIIVIVSALVGAFSGGFMTYNFTLQSGKIDDSLNGYIGEFQEAYQNVVDNYYQKINKAQLIDNAIDGMLSNLDGYTSYMNGAETREFNERIEGQYRGVGIEFVTTEEKEYIITKVIDNSPAIKAGIKIGDVIIKVDNMTAAENTGTQLATYIKEGTKKEITLVVKRDTKNLTLKIKKEIILIPSVTSKTYNKDGKNIGYINISLFADNTYTQFKKQLTALEKAGIKSLIIDVRNNSGGYLHSASDILEMFLSKGDIIYEMQNAEGTIKFTDDTSEKRTYPVAILINSYSASASEVLAASLNDNYNAKLIGETTYGKGTVQKPSYLSNGGMLKVTTDKWLTPKGAWIDKVGIKPNIPVLLTESYNENPSDETDAQLQTAIDEMAK